MGSKLLTSEAMPTQPFPRLARRPAHGLSLVEIMIMLALIGLLAATLLPHYQRYVFKTRATAATQDLTRLRQTLEERFKKTASYPAYPSGTLIDATPSARPQQLAQDFAGWIPSQGKWFTYSIASTASGYTVLATGMGSMKCTLRLDQQNQRSATGNGCGFDKW